MARYNKLVRDRIPAIIEAAGERPSTRVLSCEEWGAALRAKLQEEVSEYLENPCLDEMADIVEVLRALLIASANTWDQLETTRVNKRQARGGFDDRIWLMSTESGL